MKYRSLTHIHFTRSISESQWSIIPSATFLHQIVFEIRSENCWTIKYVTVLHILGKVNFCVTLIHYTNYAVHPSNNLEDIKQNHYTMKYRSCWLIFTLRSKFGSPCLIIWKYDTHASNSLGDIRQTIWTMKYRPHRPTFILRSNVMSYWPLIPKYDVHKSNSLQDIRQNHWAIKYRSQWPIFILR